MDETNGVDPLNAHIAAELRRARLESGITWRALAAESRHSTSVLHHWFTGQRAPTIRDIRDLAEAMGVPWRDIIIRAADAADAAERRSSAAGLE